MAEPIDLAPIRARLAAATPGPWQYDGVAFVFARVARGGLQPVLEVRGSGCAEFAPRMDANGALAAAAPADLAALCDEVERLRAAAVEAYKALLAAWDDGCFECCGRWPEEHAATCWFPMAHAAMERLRAAGVEPPRGWFGAHRDAVIRGNRKNEEAADGRPR